MIKKLKKNKEFNIFYNALSVGWHLRKIMEIEPKLMEDKESYNRFVLWLERHEIKKKYYEKQKRSKS